jgi:hypothetical protein
LKEPLQVVASDPIPYSKEQLLIEIQEYAESLPQESLYAWWLCARFFDRVREQSRFALEQANMAASQGKGGLVWFKLARPGQPFTDVGYATAAMPMAVAGA